MWTDGLADLRTQTIATSQPAPEGLRPQVLGIVNAPLEWGGVTWAAYMWNDVVNRTPRERKELFLHELFHGVVQRKLGLIPQGQGLSNEHLDAVDGRYWLRLEWRALARALRESGPQRNASVGDALAFRQARRMLYPAAVLVIRGGGGGMSNSLGAVVIPGSGTVFFGPYRLAGNWGTLEAEKGVLVTSDGSSRVVPGPVRQDEREVSGEGWTVKTAAGWIVRDGPRRGDYEVVRQP